MKKKVEIGDIVFGHIVLDIEMINGHKYCLLEDDEGRVWTDQISNVRNGLGRKHNVALAAKNGANTNYKKELEARRDTLTKVVRKPRSDKGFSKMRDDSGYNMVPTSDYDAVNVKRDGERKARRGSVKVSGRRNPGPDFKSMRVVCRYFEGICGFKLNVDHIVPVAQGGSDDRSNLMIVPARFNSKKSDQYFGEPGLSRHDFKMECASKMFAGEALDRMEFELKVIRDMCLELSRNTKAAGCDINFDSLVGYVLEIVVGADKF